MRILFLSQYYPPESNAPANRVSALARIWAAAGDDVTVMTAYPNHPEGIVYPGYEIDGVTRERDGDVEVVRMPIYAAANRGLLKRSLGFASYFASATTLGLTAVRRPDVVIGTSPQLLVGVAAAIQARRWRVPFVLEIRDLWPDSIVAVGALPEGHPTIRALRVLERRLYAAADAIVVVTEAFRRELLERGVEDRRMAVIPNGLDGELFDPTPLADDPPRRPERFVLCFAGTIGMAHGLGTVLEAAKILGKTRPEVLFLLVGEGAERAALQRRATSDGLDNVVFTGRLPREQIPGLLRSSDVSLIMLRDSPLFRTVLPSKLFEAMGCGRPILLGVDGEARRLLETAGAGTYFDPGSTAALVEAVEAAMAAPERLREEGRRGSVFVRNQYDRVALASYYRECLGRLVI